MPSVTNTTDTVTTTVLTVHTLLLHHCKSQLHTQRTADKSLQIYTGQFTDALYNAAFNRQARSVIIAVTGSCHIDLQSTNKR